jgi:pentatricopeptide repeat protein
MSLNDATCEWIKQAENKKNADRALSILDNDITAVDLLPDVYTYGCLVSTLGRLGDHIRAFELLPRMVKEGIVPNTVSLTNQSIHYLLPLLEAFIVIPSAYRLYIQV